MRRCSKGDDRASERGRLRRPIKLRGVYQVAVGLSSPLGQTGNGSHGAALGHARGLAPGGWLPVQRRAAQRLQACNRLAPLAPRPRQIRGGARRGERAGGCGGSTTKESGQPTSGGWYRGGGDFWVRRHQRLQLGKLPARPGHIRLHRTLLCGVELTQQRDAGEHARMLRADIAQMAHHHIALHCLGQFIEASMQAAERQNPRWWQGGESMQHQCHLLADCLRMRG